MTNGFLYVEDDPLSREMMKLVIEVILKEPVTIFSDSENFMERLASLHAIPKVILLDIHMKPHTGFELLAMLKDSPVYHQIPTIALTASVMNEEVSKLRTSGFDGAIAKPINVQHFPHLIEQILDGQQIWHIGD